MPWVGWAKETQVGQVRRYCPSCGAQADLTAIACPHCGSPLGSPTGETSPASASSTAPGSGSSSPRPDRDTRRTVSGLLVLIVGLALAWIPLFGLLGGILILAGFYYVYAGREALGEVHRRRVETGGNLLLATVVVGLLASFAGVPVVGGRFGPGVLGTWVVGVGIVTTCLGVLALISLVYDLADPTALRLLWTGLGLALATVVAGGLVPAVGALNHELLRRVAGGLAGSVSIGGAGPLAVVPYVVFVVAIVRCREEARRRLGQAPT